jgi:PAS domain S-box-containing protein
LKTDPNILIASSNFGILSADPNGIITSWNNTAQKIFTRTEKDAIGAHIETLLNGHEQKLINASFQHTFMHKKLSEFEVDVADKNGTNIAIAVSLSPMMDKNETCIGVSIWLRNITNRRVLEYQLEKNEHMAALGNLAAGVAHNFNNITGGIGTIVDFALESDSPSTIRKALEMTSEAVARMRKITGSLLVFAEQDTLQYDLSDFTEVLLTFIHMVETTLTEKKIQITLDIESTLIFEVAGSKMHQLLNNLVDNAIDAMPQGGSIVINVKTTKQIIILTFSDTGCGINLLNMPHIFEPFFTTHDVIQGGHLNREGLGLSVVHGIITKLGGEITCNSEIGQGTTFTIKLPIKKIVS